MNIQMTIFTENIPSRTLAKNIFFVSQAHLTLIVFHLWLAQYCAFLLARTLFVSKDRSGYSGQCNVWLQALSKPANRALQRTTILVLNSERNKSCPPQLCPLSKINQPHSTHKDISSIVHESRTFSITLSFEY